MALTEVFIDPVLYPRALSPTNQMRQWEYGGKLWTAVCDDLGLWLTEFDPTWHETVLMYSSADNGVTWTEQDSTHRPPGKGGSVVRVGNTLHLFFTHYSDLHIHYRKFDLTTALWSSSDISSSTFSMSGGAPWLYAGVNSSGVFQIAYASSSGSASVLTYVTYNASTDTWGTPNQMTGTLSGTSSTSPCGFLVDATDTVRILYQLDTFSPTTHTIHYVGISSSGTVGTTVQVWDKSSGANSSGGPGYSVVWAGTWCIPYAKTDGASHAYPALYYADLSAGLNLTFTGPESASSTHNTSFGSVGQCVQDLVVHGGSLYYWWCTKPAYGSGPGIICYNSNSGSGWGTDVEYFTDSPSNSTDDFYEELCVVWLSDGTWGVGHDRIWPGNEANSAACYLSAPASAPITHYYYYPAPVHLLQLGQGEFRRILGLGVPPKA